MKHISLFACGLFILLFLAACSERRTPTPVGPPDAGSLGSDVSMGVDVPVPPTGCDNGVRDGDETHLDCGGSCAPCADGSGCVRPADCVSGSCSDGFCLVASCRDGVVNGAEVATDCGGPDCGGCPGGSACVESTDCLSGLCGGGLCASVACTDGRLNGTETDIDCGGDVCAPCLGGRACLRREDCESLACVGEVCTAPTCDDRILNNGESAIDCGGENCGPCTGGSGCRESSDCISNRCVDGLCVEPNCEDMIMNQDETDADCGGEDCEARCTTGEMCLVTDDCDGGLCAPITNVCQAPACDDGIKNGDETSVDCGGATTCDRCPDFSVCGAASDCETGACTMGFCGATGCVPFPGTPTDSFGYFGCSIPAGAATTCPDISTTGTLLRLTGNSFEAVPIGFSFDFYGTAYTDIDVQSNGTLTFRGRYHSLANRCLPSTSSLPDRYIAVFWDDLDPTDVGGNVRYQTLGTAPSRQFVVRWETQRSPSSPMLATFIAVLSEGTDDIQVCYVDSIFGSAVHDNGNGATAGIHGPTAGLGFSCNTPDLISGLTLRYLHP